MDLSSVEITSSRLILKSFTHLDADEILQCITPTLTQYMSWDPPQTRQAFDDVCHAWLMNMKHGTELTCVIRNNANHAFLGLVALHRVQSECPELGIWIREDQHKLGFGFEAVHCLAHWASHNLNIQQFSYPVAIHNLASRRIAESLGGIAHHYEKKPKYDSVTYHIPTVA